MCILDYSSVIRHFSWIWLIWLIYLENIFKHNRPYEFTFGVPKALEINYFFSSSSVVSDLIDLNYGKISEGGKQEFFQRSEPWRVKSYLHISCRQANSRTKGYICIHFTILSVHMKTTTSALVCNGVYLSKIRRTLLFDFLKSQPLWCKILSLTGRWSEEG